MLVATKALAVEPIINTPTTTGKINDFLKIFLCIRYDYYTIGLLPLLTVQSPVCDLACQLQVQSADVHDEASKFGGLLVERGAAGAAAGIFVVEAFAHAFIDVFFGFFASFD